MATVVGLADSIATAGFVDQDVQRWWLHVWWGTPEPLPQMYRAAEILGLPAVGLFAEAERDDATAAVGP